MIVSPFLVEKDLERQFLKIVLIILLIKKDLLLWPQIKILSTFILGLSVPDINCDHFQNLFFYK